MYKIRDGGGKNNVGIGKLDFIESKYKEKQPETNFNFTKYTGGISEEHSNKSKKDKKNTDLANFSDNNSDETDPIRPGYTDESSITFDDGNAIQNKYNNKK